MFWQQGKFLAGLWVLIAICIVYYFGVLSHMAMSDVLVVLFCSIMGILVLMASPGRHPDQHPSPIHGPPLRPSAVNR